VTELKFLALLNAIEFPRLYWEFCDRFPPRPGYRTPSGWKETIIAAFQEIGVNPRYDRNDRGFIFEEEQIGTFTWDGMFCMQRNGLELIFSGQSRDQHLGTSLAVLAYDAKRLADPAFKRDQFSGPRPYPKPSYNGELCALKDIVKEFVVLVRLIKDAIRRAEAGEKA
jgi:hypothetical protein